MLSYVPAGVPLYTEFSNFSREWGTARPDLRTTPEYDDTTWAARTWSTWAAQQISVAVQQAIAEEIAHALGMPTA